MIFLPDDKLGVIFFFGTSSLLNFPVLLQVAPQSCGTTSSGLAMRPVTALAAATAGLDK